MPIAEKQSGTICTAVATWFDAQKNVSTGCEFRGNPAGDSDLMSATVPI